MRMKTAPAPRGTIYVAVLGAAMIVAVIGLSAVMVARIERRAAEGISDVAEARFYARSAIEWGMLRVNQDANWRTSFPNGVWAADQPIGGGTFTLEGVDPNDGVLADSATDPLVLTGTGVKGAARHKTQVTLVSQTSALTCLEVPLHAGNDLLFNSATVVSAQPISANDSADASRSEVYANVEAVNAIAGGNYRMLKTTGITPRAMPDSTVFDFYVANGTPIDMTSIPEVSTHRLIEGVVISPTSNPYGDQTNDDGIYVINTYGEPIRIRNARIQGTLVILDPPSASRIEQSMVWSPGVPNYPALLVRGSFDIRMTNTPLGSDPSRIQGLVYVSADLTTSNYVTIDGALVVGVTLSAGGSLYLTYDQTFLNNSPPGFGEPPMIRVLEGSWSPIVD